MNQLGAYPPFSLPSFDTTEIRDPALLNICLAVSLLLGDVLPYIYQKDSKIEREGGVPTVLGHR